MIQKLWKEQHDISPKPWGGSVCPSINPTPEHLIYKLKIFSQIPPASHRIHFCLNFMLNLERIETRLNL